MRTEELSIVTEISQSVVPLIVGLSPVHLSDQLGHLHPALSPRSWKDLSEARRVSVASPRLRSVMTTVL